MKQTSKKLWSILLSLALVLGLVPGIGMTALAADNQNATTEDDVQAVFTEGGTVKLGADITLSSALTVPQEKTVTLDLNGFVLRRNLEAATANGYVIFNEGTLTITDSNNTKANTVEIYYYDKDDTSKPIKTGDEEITGGAITGGFNNNRGGGIYNSKGTLYIQGGNICGNEAQYSEGGGIFNLEGSVTISGGNIQCNKASDGGGVENYFGTLTMRGGSISKNVASSSYGAGVISTGGSANKPTRFIMSGGTISDNVSRFGNGGSGAVYINSWGDNIFIMTGGAIQNNIADKGAGIYVAGDSRDTASPFQLSGDAVISGNKKPDGTNSDVCLNKNSRPIAITDIWNGDTTTGIEVESEKPFVFTTGGAEYINRFSSDDSNYIVVADNGNLKLEAPHGHSFTYGTSGATITATCGAAGCDLTDSKATLTIAAPALTTYGGTESANATLTGLDDFNTATGLNVSANDINYVGRDGTTYDESSEAPTNAGKYTATITIYINGVDSHGLGSVVPLTASVDYEIAKAEPAFDIPTGVKAVVGDTLGTVTPPTGWAWADDTVTIENKGINTFKATFTPEDKTNYNIVENNDIDVYAYEYHEEVPAQCEKNGVTEYYEDGEGNKFSDLGETPLTDEQTVIEKLGHNFIHFIKWVWDGFNHAIAWIFCDNDPEHIETIDVASVIETVDTPDCTTDGYNYHVATIDIAGTIYSTVNVETVDQLGHDWSQPEYTWAPDPSNGCKAVRYCLRDGCGHFEREFAEDKARLSYEVIKDATCEENGIGKYTADFENDAFETQTATVDIPALGHDWGDPEWTWNDDYTEASATFTCKNDSTHTETATADIASETTPATTEADGKTVYTAKVTFNGKDYEDTKTVVIPKIVENEYVVLNQGDITWKPGDGAFTLLIKRTDGETSADKLVGVTVGGTPIPSMFYIVHETADGLAITFPEEVLASIPSGEYTVVVNFTDGTVEKKITIESADIPPLSGILGDVNDDGVVDSTDALLILRNSVGLETFDDTQKFLGDVNEDNENIDSSDALAVLRYSVGLIDIEKIGTPVTKQAS